MSNNAISIDDLKARNPEVPFHRTPEHHENLVKIRETTRPAMLENLKPIYHAHGQTPKSLEELTGIPKARIQKLANYSAMEEPWFDEAVLLARALCTNGIVPLITSSGRLSECPVGVHIGTDVTAYRMGVRLPLSVACRLAMRFGLDDPMELSGHSRHMQIWDVLSRNERGAEPGQCPWCLADVHAGAEHDEMCLPNNLWGPRNMGDARDLMFPLRPSAKARRKMPGARGLGIRPLRTRLCMTQRQFGDRCGITESYLARMERCELTLTLPQAEKIAAAFGVTIESLYVLPEGTAEPVKGEQGPRFRNGRRTLPSAPPAPPVVAP